MHSTIDDMGQLLAEAGELAETNIEIAKLKVAGKVSESLSHVIAITILMVLISAAVIIISIGFAFLIGQWLHNTSYGFFIIGGIYALLSVLAYMNRKKWLELPLSNVFITKMANDGKD